MTDWWDHGYPGGPMVKVPGFPRPLYPPDAARYGKRPSIDGPDITAYKRTVSRAGRWPWQQFDDSFSNGFAHGKSGNVGQTGVAGVQRQGGIDDTGWLGKTTFNLLRSIRIPAPLDHAGDPAMDAYAANLIAQAWALYGGAEPDPPSRGTVRGAALERAASQIGECENPPSSNRTKYGAWYGVDGQPWCAIFVTWCYELGAADIDKDSPSFLAGSRWAYVPYIVADARNNNYGLTTTDDPQPGDLCCFNWDPAMGGEYDHVGLFEAWQGDGLFSTIEGNTSQADNSNGGEVMRRSRSRGTQGTVFVHVAEP